MNNIMKGIIATPTKLLGMTLAIIILFLPLSSYAADRVIVFVNGYQDCCAHDLHKVEEFVIRNNFRIIRTAWSSFSDGSVDKAFINAQGTSNFIEGAGNFFSSLPADTEVYLIGHSFGGDSILALLNNYRTQRLKFKLVDVLDPVGFGGFRESVKQYSVPAFVEYFYNRWQTNAPFPNDFLNSGSVSCSAKVCDQQEQSISRNSDYSPIRERCGDLEICPGKRTITNKYGIPMGVYPGDKQKRLLHQPLAYDEYIQQQIINIINSSTAVPPDGSPPGSGVRGVIYGITPNGLLHWYKHLGQDDGTASWANGGNEKEIGHGWNAYISVFP